MFWSGGKDSSLALYIIQQSRPDLDVVYLVTTVNEEYQRISMHGVRQELLSLQAGLLGVPLFKMVVPNSASNQSYETALEQTFRKLKKEGISHIVYGDIFLEDLRSYRDAILQQHQLTGVYPLWKEDTAALVRKFLELGFRTITCCISTAWLSEDWVGRELSADFISELPSNVDPCGENGEFHTFCFDGPIFRKALRFKLGSREFKPLSVHTISDSKPSGFWYVDLLPD